MFGLGFLRSVASREAHVHFTTAMLHWYQVCGWEGARRGYWSGQKSARRGCWSGQKGRE